MSDVIVRKENAAATSASAARPVQARSRRTREKLLEAATLLLVERGYGGWRFADVAAEAGVSLGALTHHYPDKATLLIALTEAICERSLAAGLAAARAAEASDDIVRDLLNALRAAYFTTDYDALREIGNAVHSNKAIFPQIEPGLTAYRTTVNEAWLAAFSRQGYSATQARTVFEISVNMVRGMAAHATWRPDQHAADALIQNWIAMARSHLDNPGAEAPAAAR